MSEQNKPSYDPNKKYSWTPETQFTLSGGEFGLILNALRSVLSTKEAAAILIANEANRVLEASLANAVEAGIVNEVPEQNI